MSRLQSFSKSALVIFVSGCMAQSPEISIQEPKPVPVVGPLLRPFHFGRRTVSPVNFGNTPRLESLVRAGNLYLSVQDVIALVLENNVDIAIQRYGPYVSREIVRRAQGGGFLRAVSTPLYAGPSSVSTTGVSVQTVGLAESASGVTSGGGIVSQIGTPPPNLDPFFFVQANFQHQTIPQSNTFLNPVPSLLNDSRNYTAQYQQSFTTGFTAAVTYSSSRNLYNSPAYVLNPYTSGFLDVFLQQNLLQGFGSGVNNRNIRVARNNLKVTDLQVKRQVITTISAALNLYWDLVSFSEDVRIKQQALATAEKLHSDNEKQVKAGALSAIEVTRAAAEVSASKENLLISQTNVAQQETVLKNALSRNGVASPWLDDVHIVPLDRIQVPEKDELKPSGELITTALAQRPELDVAKTNIDSTKINLSGTRNALLPTLQAFAEFTNNGLTGVENALANGANGTPDPFILGGYGNLLGQLFRRNYPNYSVGFSVNIPIRNRAAQADYVTDQLALRQSELQLQRSISQVRVDVKNAIIGLQQARARYETTVATRLLAEQTLNAEQRRFQFGEATSSIALIVQSQRDLATAQTAEVQAMANYTHAKVAFDESIGQTLETNGITMDEVNIGRVARQSAIPDVLPDQKSNRERKP